jgi:hypothetical protein
MMRRVRNDRAQQRGYGQWFLTVLLLVCGLGMVVGFVVTETRDYSLRTHGIRTVATVQDQQGTGRSIAYLLDFSDRDGTPRSEWSGDVSSGAKVGDHIRVVYDPNDPSDLQDARDLDRGPWASLILLLGGAFFIWLSYRYFRAEPTAFRQWLRHRYRIR